MVFPEDNAPEHTAQTAQGRVDTLSASSHEGCTWFSDSVWAGGACQVASTWLPGPDVSPREDLIIYSLHPSVVLLLWLIGDGRSGTCPWTAGRPAWHQYRLQWACTRTAGSKGALCGRWVAPDGSRNTDRPRPAPPELPVAEETNNTLVRMNPKQQNTFIRRSFYSQKMSLSSNDLLLQTEEFRLLRLVLALF